jgi:hypothetical protein
VTEVSLIIGGAVLVLVLLMLGKQGWLASQNLQAPLESSDEEIKEGCPEEFVQRIFSRTDWDFVRSLKARNIERSYVRERKIVALVWVRQTLKLIGTVMRGHAEAARQSKNLEISMEFRILAQYLILMVVCWMLFMTIQIGGPLWVGRLAAYAQDLSLKIERLHESSQANAFVQTARQDGV